MTPEQIRQEAEREYPVIVERDFNPLSDGSLDINESAREAYIKGRMKSLEEKEKEIAELKSEIDEMVKLKDYWFNRCYQAEHFIEKSPCDPDITADQIEAYKMWNESKKHNP